MEEKDENTMPRQPRKLIELHNGMLVDREEHPAEGFLSLLERGFDAIMALKESKRLEYEAFKKNYREELTAKLAKLVSKEEQMKYLFSEIGVFEEKRIAAKAERHELNRLKYESVLDEVLYPWKTHLIGIMEAEAKLKTTLIEPENIFPKAEDRGWVDAINAYDAEEQKPIPLQLVEPSLPEDVGNLAYLRGRRKFIWIDEEAAFLSACFLLNKGLVPSYQEGVLEEFLKTGKCNQKIVFFGNGNVLTTFFFLLREQGYLRVSLTYLADRVEQIFVSHENTLKPLILKKSFLADMKPSAVNRRLKEGSETYPDIIRILKPHFKK